MVDEAIETKANRITDGSATYDISKIDFDRLRKEFERSPAKRTTVQNLKQAIENRLRRLLEQNPLRTDFQRHYEETVAEEVFRHVYRAYPTAPSPYYEHSAVA